MSSTQGKKDVTAAESQSAKAPPENDSAGAVYPSGFVGAVFGLAFGLFLAWLLQVNEDRVVLYGILGAVALGLICLASPAKDEDAAGPKAAWRAIRFLLDASIRVLLLAWLIVWLQGHIETRSALDKAKEVEKRSVQRP